ncbi:hypothetical protein IFR04_007609 [Cadophora malorum]|uniref:Enoyl reductase (ER) domain-containing protein n=1 Tax=Cadophora malorum TaxID=108018 RepID=A0A8H7W6V2_9HELO|nr:hypothetical protein IFR04_007609 [Cadophora malorum]
MSFEIPKTYNAAVYDNPGQISTHIEQLQTPEPGPGEVLVRLTHSGVCHSDLSIMRCGWAGLPPTPKGQVGGHEGIGIIQKLGPGAEKNVRLGDRVGIKWAAAMCEKCGPCRNGFDGHCVLKKFSGYYTPGTFAEYAIAQANYVTPIPTNIDSIDAAPMLCAGLTVYTALLKANAKKGDWVAVSGAGGGLGHIALQIGSRGMDFRMIGIDHPSKSSLIKECGAEVFVDMTSFDDAGIAEETKRITDGEGAKAVIVCAGSNRAYGQALGMVGFGGTVVCVGIPEGEPVLVGGAYPGAMLTQQKSIVGSSLGSQKEAIEVLELAARGVVKTKIRVEKLDRLTDVFQEMADGKMEGRV